MSSFGAENFASFVDVVCYKDVLRFLNLTAGSFSLQKVAPLSIEVHSRVRTFRDVKSPSRLEQVVGQILRNSIHQ